MSRKIMVLCGSPRKKGNTNRLAQQFVQGATGAGAEVEVVDAARLEYKTKGCIACMKCKKSDGFACTIDDEASPILARIPDAEAIVFATPVYWFSPTAQLKLLVDRMFSLIKTDPDGQGFHHPMAGKTLALIATGGGGFEDGLNCVDLTFKTMAGFLGMKYEPFFLPNSPAEPEDIEELADVLEKVETLGRKLAEG